jgi:hypothetical protein
VMEFVEGEDLGQLVSEDRRRRGIETVLGLRAGAKLAQVLGAIGAVIARNSARPAGAGIGHVGHLDVLH